MKKEEEEEKTNFKFIEKKKLKKKHARISGGY